MSIANILLVCILSFSAQGQDCLDIATVAPSQCVDLKNKCTPFETLGLFTSCHKEYLESCTHLVQTLLKEHQKIPLSVLVDESLFSDKIFCSNFRPLQRTLQIVAVKEPAKFMRDPGFFNNQNTYSALPYGIMGAQSVAAFFSQCKGVKVEQALSGANLINNKNLYENNLDPQTFELRSDGGNILFLDGKTAVVGETQSRPFPGAVEKYLAQSKRVLKIKIPTLLVGHIDEIFYRIEAKNSCGYQILSASTLKMKMFLETQPNLNLYPMPLSPSRKKELETVFEQIQSRKIAKRPIPIEWTKKFEVNPMVSAADVLRQKSLMVLWDLWQKQIDQAKLQLKSQVSCPIQFIDLPVFWNEKGQAVLTNPINGFYINKKYLISKPFRIEKIDYELSDRIYERPRTIDFGLYEKEVKKILNPIEVKSIDLKDYDSGGGNLHCATQQISCVR